uniref:Nerve growth factor receptor n=1 Tax=Oncorhynchus kisutch TaxID=8019 RepID=A0A8C7F9H5_ONCKI
VCARVCARVCACMGVCRAVQVPCESGQYTKGGECCEVCPPGEGVVRRCGANQTVCAQCLDSETYSETYSHTDTCIPCTMCTGLMRMQTPCTDSNNAICVCDYNYYLNEVSGRCEPCTVCPAGQGVLAHCEHNHDTVCEECIDDTYSDRDSSLDPCLPCTICDEGIEVELSACTPVSDSFCHNPLLPSYTSPTFPLDLSSPSFTDIFPPDSSSSPSPGGESTTAQTSPHFIRPGFNENLIPIYCSILAAVVVGLVAYIVFKSREIGYEHISSYHTDRRIYHTDRSSYHTDKSNTDRSSYHTDRSSYHTERSSYHTDRSSYHTDRSSYHTDRTRDKAGRMIHVCRQWVSGWRRERE